MKENINNFIVNDEDLNVDQLLDETLTLFGENSTTISMFDMLHNMRQIDDSTYAHSVNVALICRLIGKWKNFSEKDSIWQQLNVISEKSLSWMWM